MRVNGHEPVHWVADLVYEFHKRVCACSAWSSVYICPIVDCSGSRCFKQRRQVAFCLDTSVKFAKRTIASSCLSSLFAARKLHLRNQIEFWVDVQHPYGSVCLNPAGKSTNPAFSHSAIFELVFDQGQARHATSEGLALAPVSVRSLDAVIDSALGTVTDGIAFPRRMS
jgi:hypothetical protein